MPEHEFDTQFAMPAVDQPALTEIGVVLAGLDIERLLAGLGTAGAEGGGDPARVVLRVDQLRHGGDGLDAALAAGAHLWRAARAALAAVDRGPSVSGSVRQAWQRAMRTVLAAGHSDDSAATACLAACWLRCHEVDHAVQELADPTRLGAPRAATPTR